jgi:purine nucleosidase
MKKVIFDGDNTMGLPERDVDDALAILFLLGRPEVELLGVTTTFGNDSLDRVFDTTRALLHDIGRGDLPLSKGGPPEDRRSDAAQFLADSVHDAPGEVTIVATGAMTNLMGAQLIDGDFFAKLGSIVLMGGVTSPLRVGSVEVEELNLSCDAEAAFRVLSSGAPVTVMTGHLCLEAVFGTGEFDYLDRSDHPLLRYVAGKIAHWREFNRETYGLDGFYNWDVAAAMYLTHPQLFEGPPRRLVSTVEDLQTGFLRETRDLDEGYPVTMPEHITDLPAFNRILLSTWERISI